jgi:hypothetical protein
MTTPVNPIVFDRPRAKAVVTGIFAALASGAYINRAFVVRRFTDAGYVPSLAERYADTLIARNTDIAHFSRWSTWGTGDNVTYSFAG